MHKAPRASTEHERLTLKAAVARALKMAGGAASFQHVTRLHESNLSRAASPQAEDQHLPLDVVLDLDREAQAPVVLSELARLIGYQVKPLAAAGEVSDIGVGDVTRLMGATHKAASAVMGAIEDGQILPHEAKAVCTDIDKAIRELTTIRARLPVARGAK